MRDVTPCLMFRRLVVRRQPTTLSLPRPLSFIPPPPPVPPLFIFCFPEKVLVGTSPIPPRLTYSLVPRPQGNSRDVRWVSLVITL